MASESPEPQREHAGSPRAKQVSSNLALFAVASVVSLLIAEVAVRALDLAPSIVPIGIGRFQLSPNLKIGYEPIPNLEYQGESLRYFQYRGTSNELGYRGPMYPEQKSPDAYRIVVLGDSVTAGIGFDDYEDIYTAKLESALRQEGIRAEVLNFGVSGYNTQQEVETLKDKGLAFDPDLVILAYSLNDTQGPYYRMLKPLMEQSNDKQNPRALGGFVDRALLESALYRLVRFRLFAPSADEEEELTFEQYATGNTVAEYAKELFELSKLHDFQVLVVVFPKGNDRSFTNYPFHEDHEFIREIAIEQRFWFLDLLPTYAACAEKNEKDIYRDNLHPNRRGHICAADAITDFVLEIERKS